MKVIAINGSPHKNGNTNRLIETIFSGARQHGHTCQTVHLVDLHLDYCNWCQECGPTGICRIQDGFQEHVKQINQADLMIVATPSSTRSVTGYMKNWLDRFCNSQLSYKVDENHQAILISRLTPGKKAVIIVQGCTDLFQETIEPINVVMDVLEVQVVKRLIVAKIGQTANDTIDKRPEALEEAYQIGLSL